MIQLGRGVTHHTKIRSSLWSVHRPFSEPPASFHPDSINLCREESNISKPRKVTPGLFGQFSQIYRCASRFNQQQNSKLDAARKSRAEKDRRNRKASSGGKVRAPKIFFFSRHSSLRCNLCASRSFCLHIHVPFFCSARNTTINKFDFIDN